MRDVLDDIERWRLDGRRLAVARVVGIEGSGPRDPGATLVASDAGEVAGSVSGGCVEGAVVTEALAVLRGEEPRLVTYGIADEEAFSVGLTCGGTIHILVEPLDWFPIYEVLRDALRSEEPVAVVTVVEGPSLGTKLVVGEQIEAVGSLGAADLDEVVKRDALGQLQSALTGTRHYGLHGEARQAEVEVVRNRAHRRVALAHQREHCFPVAHIERREDQALARMGCQERREMSGMRIREADFFYFGVLQQVISAGGALEARAEY